MDELMFSVAVITFNQEKFISQTLDSILQQKHSYSYEIVIGDDGSLDSTKNIIMEYAKRYPYIIKPIFNNVNVGLIKNYFNVIKRCTGKYIMECAGDDWWLEGKVQRQIDFMESHPNVGMCYGRVQNCDENGVFLGSLSGQPCEHLEQLLTCNEIPAVSVCFKKSIIKDYIKDVSPETQPWIMEDYPTWLWMSKNTTISFLDAELASYRHISESVSRSQDVNAILLFEENTYQIRSFFATKYNLELKPFNREELKQKLLFKKVLTSYDKNLAGELRRSLVLNNFKNMVKYVLLSSKFLMKLYTFFKKV